MTNLETLPNIGPKLASCATALTPGVLSRGALDGVRWTTGQRT